MSGPSLAIRSQCPNATVDNDGLMTKEQVQELEAAASSGFTNTAIKTAAYVASASQRVLVDTSGSATIAISLPAAPADGAEVQVANVSFDSTGSVIVDGNGHDMLGFDVGFTLDPYESATFAYSSAAASGSGAWMVF